MNDSRPVFVADTCIGGLSVVKSLWDSRCAGNAVFLADYTVNPLGVKDDAAIADVVDRWLGLAAEQSDTLFIACNTLSIRYRQVFQSKAAGSGLRQIVSMADCVEAMATAEAERLEGRRALIIGTAFTASQGLYPDILRDAMPGIRVDTVAATELERRIARFEPWNIGEDAVLTDELRQALGDTDIAVLACTCFPMAAAELQLMYPDVIFLDPAGYSVGLVKENVEAQEKKLFIKVTGEVVSTARVAGFAKSYLGTDSINA